MSEDKPSYDSNKMRQAAKVREVLRISATLEKPQVAREIILEWLENDASTELPEGAWKGDAFQHEANDRSFTAVRAKGDTSDAWALRFAEPGEGDTEQLWTTEIATREQSGQEPLFSVRTLVKSTDHKLRSQPTVPRFMEHVAGECGLEQGAAKIEKDPWIIESDYDAANLTEFLVDPDRRTPAFVLTVAEEAENPTEPLIEAGPLATDTLGIAKVVVLPAEYTWKLTNRFGKRLSVYRGALRVYLPGFREDTDPEGGHDLFMPHRMDTPETAARLGSLLRWMAVRESLKRMRLGQEVLPFASVLMPSIDFETQKLAASKASAAKQLTAAKEHLGILRQELQAALQMQQWLTEETKFLEGRVREAESRARGGVRSGSRPPYDRQRDRAPRPRYSSYDSDRPERQGGGFNRDRPSGGYGRDRPAGGFDRGRPSGGYDRDRPSGGYGRNRPSGGYDRQSRGYDRDRQGGGYDRERKPRGYDRGRESDASDYDSSSED